MRCCVFFSTFLLAALLVFTGCGESISPVCGDNTAQGTEVCDGTDLAGEDCVSQGFTGGTLSCLADCSGFDTSLCTGAPVCGDNVAQGTEVCDGTDLAGEDCVSQGFTGGTLSCLADCSGFDTSLCTGAPVCGDNVAQGTEVCDGTDLAGEDCVSQGFTGGTLSCLADCSGFDTSLCTGAPVCGDNVAQGTEVCDGTDLAGEDCVSQGFTGGTLACLGDCSGFDTTGCTVPVCGDNIVEGTEVCDGTDLAGEDCVSQGFTGGTLACLGDCSGFDTTGCTSCTLSGAFEFVHPTGSGSSVQDCITADVCLTRGYIGPLYNAAGIAPAEYPRDFFIQWPGDTDEPNGTRWAPTDCASAQPSDFTTFVAALQFDVGNNVLTTPLCLSIPAANLFYDVDFSAWQRGPRVDGGGGAFTYTRTAASPDECAHGDATCGAACGCPDGFVVDASSGKCRLPDPCDPNPCGSGASCRRLGIADHVCECDTVEFTNDQGSCDSITPDVCIARGVEEGLYNSEDELGYNWVAECVSPSPTLTEWASLPCAQATDIDFGTWVSSTFMDLPFCTPPQMVGVAACVRLTDGSNQEWDIRMTDWCIGELRGGGCFSYIRSHNVDDVQPCGTGGSGGAGGMGGTGGVGGN